MSLLQRIDLFTQRYFCKIMVNVVLEIVLENSFHHYLILISHFFLTLLSPSSLYFLHLLIFLKIWAAAVNVRNYFLTQKSFKKHCI